METRYKYLTMRAMFTCDLSRANSVVCQHSCGHEGSVKFQPFLASSLVKISPRTEKLHMKTQRTVAWSVVGHGELPEVVSGVLKPSSKELRHEDSV